jgi:hypothetical protein
VTDDASVLGIRASWTCAECRATTVSRQIAAIEHAPDIGVVIVLDLPEGWEAKGHETFCPAHAPVKLQKARVTEA